MMLGTRECFIRFYNIGQYNMIEHKTNEIIFSALFFSLLDIFPLLCSSHTRMNNSNRRTIFSLRFASMFVEKLNETAADETRFGERQKKIKMKFHYMCFLFRSLGRPVDRWSQLCVCVRVLVLVQSIQCTSSSGVRCVECVCA